MRIKAYLDSEASEEAKDEPFLEFPPITDSLPPTISQRGRGRTVTVAIVHFPRGQRRGRRAAGAGEGGGEGLSVSAPLPPSLVFPKPPNAIR